MPFMIPSKETSSFTGTGEGVLLYMKCGMGDCIQALPVVAELASRERVTILTELNKLEFWQLVQETIPIIIKTQTPMMQAGFMDLAWLEQVKRDYARVHVMLSWTTWETPLVRDTIEAFAEAVQGVVPEAFDYQKALQPERTFDTNYILFAPESTESYRSFTEEKAQEVFQALQREYGKVIWLSKFNASINGDEFTILCDSIDDNEELRSAWMKLQAEADATERIRMVGKTDCDTFAELRDLVYNADYIVTVESGISNLAGALGKDMVIVCSVTDPLHIVGQYKRFHSFDYTTVRAEHPQCGGVCWRKTELGHSKSCLKNCLATIESQKVLDSVPIFQ